MGRRAAAVAAGVLLGLAFPPYGAWPVGFVAVAALSLLVRGARPKAAAGLGFLFGLGFFVVLLRWMSVVGVDAMLGLAALQAAFFAPLGAVLAYTGRARAWPLWHAAAWVLEEALRARLPFGGLPWGRLAFAQADSPLAGLAALGGSPLVSFAAAAVGTSLAAAALAVRGGAGRPAAAAALAGAAVLAAGALVPLPTGPEAGRATVALIQGNVPRAGFDTAEQQEAVFSNHIRATRQLADAVRRGEAPRPDFAVWPENASDVDPYLDHPTRARLQAAVDDLGVPTLVGVVLDAGPRYVRNAGLVWTPGFGPGDRYVKRHPVPFGEYLPMRALLEDVGLTRLVGRLALVPRDFVHGQEVGVLDIGGTRIGEVICFEVAYDGLVRDAVRAGGRLLVVQTNNATYGRTGQPEQQLAISRLRTIEHGRAMVIASTSGISAVIAPDGTVTRRSAEFTRDVIVADVPLRAARTLATNAGTWIEFMLCLVAGVGIVICRPRRTSGGEGGVAVTVIAPPEPADRPAGVLARWRRKDAVTVGLPGSVLVIIPTYNEAESLPKVVARLLAACPHVHVLVADDNSPDGTGAIADGLAAADPRVQVMHRAAKAGLGAAYIAGFRWGLARGYDVLVEMDADGSHRPEDLPRLLAALGDLSVPAAPGAGADLVLGSRWVPGGSVVNWPAARKLISRGGTLYAKLALGIPIRDATGGFRAFRRGTLEGLDLDGVASQGYCFQIDLAWRAVRRGFVVREVPITFVERELGVSKMSRSIVVEALWRVTVWGLEHRAAALRPRRSGGSAPAALTAARVDAEAGTSAEV